MASGFQRPTLTFKDARLTEISLADATFNLTFIVDNPNDEAISLAQTDYLLQIEGRQVVAGAPPAGIKIAPRSSSEVVLPANVRFVELAASLAALFSQHSVAYQASGHVGVDTPIGVATLPFSHEGRLDLPQIPSIAVGSPRLTNISLTSATLEVPLTLTNANAYALPLGVLAGALRIAGADVGAVQTAEIGMLAANGALTVVLPVQIRFAEAFAAAEALRSGTAHVSLSGELRSKSAALPIQIERDVALIKGAGSGG